MKFFWLLSLSLGISVSGQEITELSLLDRLAGSKDYCSYDEDGDGGFNAAERTALLTRLRFDYDFNSNGQLDPEELLSVLHDSYNLEFFPPKWRSTWFFQVPSRLWAEKARRLYDQDGDGQLSPEELRRAAAIDRYAVLGLTHQKADKNGNGWLEPEELQPLLGQLSLEAGSKDGRLTPEEIDRQTDRRRALSLLASTSVLQGWRKEEEPAALVKRYAKEIDLDRDGRVSEEEILMLLPRARLGRLGSLDYGYFDEPTSDGYLFFFSTREQFGAKLQQDFDTAFLKLYDADRNGKWSLGELTRAVQREHRLRAIYADDYLFTLDDGQARRKRYFYSTVFGNLTPEWQQELTAWLLAREDANHNGQLEDAEIHRRCLYVKTKAHLLAAAIWGPRNQDEFANNRECLKTALELYDWNQDQLLSLAEMRQAVLMEQGFSAMARTKVNGTERRIEPAPWPVQKKRAWLAKCLPLYDGNANNRWEEEEILRFSVEEPVWFEIGGARQEFDLDHDGWLSGAERQQATAALAPECDANRNQRLDREELLAWKETALALDRIAKSSPRKTRNRQQDRDWLLGQFDFDRNGFLDIEEAQVASRVVLLAQQYERFSASNDFFTPKERCEKTLAAWRQTEDRNHDGRLELNEAVETLQAELIIAEILANRGGSELMDLFDGIPQDRIWAVFQEHLRQEGDMDGDGKLSPAELRNAKELFSAKNSLWNKTFFARLEKKAEKTVQHGIFEQDFGPWRKAFDFNGNGKLDVPELTAAAMTNNKYRTWWIRNLDPRFAEIQKDPDPEGLRRVYDLVLKDYDDTGDGFLDDSEWRGFRNVMEAKERQRTLAAENERRLQEEARMLKQYDLDGNGQLDPDERKRAEKETQSGLKSPALEE